MHASTAEHGNALTPVSYGGDGAAALNQRQSTGTARRPWYRFRLLCCAGAQTTEDIRDPYDHNNSHQQQQYEQIRTRQAAVPAAAANISAAAVHATALPATATHAAPGPTAKAETPAALPSTAAVPRAVGKTRNLLDDDTYSHDQSPSTVTNHTDFSTPTAAADRLKALASPTAAAGSTAADSSNAFENAQAARAFKGNPAVAVRVAQVADTSDKSAADVYQHSTRHSSTNTPGSRSPAGSPRPPSPFTNRQLQDLVAAEMAKHQQQQQHADAHSLQEQQQDVAPAADDLQLPAMHLKVKTGRKTTRAAASTAPAVNTAPVKQNSSQPSQHEQQQQQERQFSLQHLGSEASQPTGLTAGGAVAAIAAAAAAEQQQKPAAAVSPRRVDYSNKLPPKLPLNQKPAVSGGIVGSSSSVGGVSSISSTDGMGSINPFQSGLAGISSDSALSPLHSSSSTGHNSYHTAPAHVQTKPSVIARDQAGGLQPEADEFRGFDNGGLHARSDPAPAVPQISHIRNTGVALSAPALAQQSSASDNNPFEHKLLADLQQQAQQGDKQQQLEEQQQQQQDAWGNSEDDQDVDVLPVVLSPLRVPSHIEQQQFAFEDDDDTPLSPKMSIVGVSHSVINNMLSEEGIPLVPTSDDLPDDVQHGIQDLFSGTPRVSFSGSFSRHYNQVPETPRRLGGVGGFRSESGLALGFNKWAGGASGTRDGVQSFELPRLGGGSSTRSWQQQRQRRYSGDVRYGYRGMRRPASSSDLQSSGAAAAAAASAAGFVPQYRGSNSAIDKGSSSRFTRRTVSATSRPPVVLSPSSAEDETEYEHDPAAAAPAPAIVVQPLFVGSSGHNSSSHVHAPASSQHGEFSPASVTAPAVAAAAAARRALSALTATGPNDAGRNSSVNVAAAGQNGHPGNRAQAVAVAAGIERQNSSSSSSSGGEMMLEANERTSSGGFDTTGGNLVRSAALFSRTGWAAFDRQASLNRQASIGPVQSLIGPAKSPAGVMQY